MSEVKQKLKYNSSEEPERFYTAINPNTEVAEQGIAWFNSDAFSRDNAYPNKLMDLYNNASAVHSNFINLKGGLNFGSGLVPLDEADQLIKDFLSRENRSGQDINQIYKKMSFDMGLFEAAALQVIYNAEGQIAEVYHCSPANLRASEPNDLGFSEFWYYSTKWGVVSNKRKRKNSNMISDAVKIATFNPANGRADKRQILYIKKYSPSQEDIYAIPSYNSVLNYVQNAFELSQLHLAKVQNGLTPSGIVVIKGNPTDEERDGFVGNFKDNHTGSDKTGKLIFIFVDGDNQTPEFVPFDTKTNDGLYDSLNDIVNEAICIGHGGSMALLGIDKAQSIGNDSMKLNTARSYFINTVIEPMQEVMLAAINKILKHNGLGQVKVVNKPLALDGTSQADTNQSGSNNEGTPAGSGSTEPQVINQALANMTGRQWQAMNRVIRNIAQGKMTKEAGILFLKNGHGLSDEIIASLLIDNEVEEVTEEDKLKQPVPVAA